MKKLGLALLGWSAPLWAFHAFDHACRQESPAYRTRNGGCEESLEGVVWGMKLDASYTYDEAIHFCAFSYRDGDFTDWQLPSRADLLRMADQQKARRNFGYAIGSADTFWAQRFSQGTSRVAVSLSSGESLPRSSADKAQVICIRRHPPQRMYCDFRQVLLGPSVHITQTIRGPAGDNLKEALCGAWNGCRHGNGATSTNQPIHRRECSLQSCHRLPNRGGVNLPPEAHLACP